MLSSLFRYIALIVRWLSWFPAPRHTTVDYDKLYAIEDAHRRVCKHPTSSMMMICMECSEVLWDGDEPDSANKLSSSSITVALDLIDHESV